MAKQRIINTKFWSDPYIQDLDAYTKLLFLYLLTNEHTDICGIYEISERTICFEINFKQDKLKQSIDRLSQDGKIYYIDGWIYIKNFSKHQNSNPSVEKGVERSLKLVPSDILAKVSEIDTGSDRLSQEGTPNLTKPNLTKPNSYESEINNTIKYWNEVNEENLGEGNFILAKKITLGMPEAYSKLRRKQSKAEFSEDFGTALYNYIADIKNRDPKNDYANHRFSLYEFIKQANGYQKFLNK